MIYILMCSNDMKGLREIATGLPWQLENTSQELKNTLLILDMVRSIGEEQFGQGKLKAKPFCTIISQKTANGCT